MGHVSRKITNWLVKHKAINPRDRELYEYAIYSFMISVMPSTIFLIISGITGMFLEGLLIVVPFMVTRKFSGGYHAGNVYICVMVSVGLLGSSFYIVIHATCRGIFHMLLLISGLSIVTHSPIDSENKKLESDEIHQYRYVTCFIVIIIILLYSILSILNQYCYAECLAISLILTAILQLPCIVKKRK